MDIPDEELNIHSEKDEDGRWITRILHLPTGTIKISDLHYSKVSAEEQAREELVVLLEERQKGLGE